jgi:hypothetical protein
MLTYYTRRSLTHQSDALRAMAGIARRVSESLRYQMFEGLPSGAFDIFVIFHAARGLMLHRRRGFPSYSWTGWRGEIAYNHEFLHNMSWNYWLRRCTWIIWYQRSPSGVLRLVWDPSANEAFPSDDSEYVGYRGRTRFRGLATIETQWQRTTPSKTGFPQTPQISYPLLQFWTVAVFLKLGKIDVFKATSSLLDSKGNDCGEAKLDGFEETTFFNPQTTLELILLSEHGRSGDYFAMILEWKDGVAERRGLATVGKSVMKTGYSPGPSWKEILLA